MNVYKGNVMSKLLLGYEPSGWSFDSGFKPVYWDMSQGRGRYMGINCFGRELYELDILMGNITFPVLERLR